MFDVFGKMSRIELMQCISKNKFKSEQAHNFYFSNKDQIGDLDKNIRYGLADLKKLIAPEKLKTEDTGLVFEYAICLYYGIPYDGKFKYETSRAEKIAEKFKHSKIQLKEITGSDIIHTAAKRARYDFTSKDGKFKFQAKTAKKLASQKQAPEVIGQTSMKKLVDHFNLPATYNTVQFKSWIIQNIDVYIIENYKFLFNEPICYFVEDKFSCFWITPIKQIKIDKELVTFTRTLDNWEESNTVKYNGISIAEIQFHKASRGNVVFRFNFSSNPKNKSGIFVAFPDYFDIKQLF